MIALSRTERSEIRKRRIIRTALECFNERGYSETTMALIRKLAGASTGSIYHHFRNKDQLAAAVYLAGILDYQRGYIEALEKQRGAKAGITAIVRYHLDWVERNPEWARYLNRMRHAQFMKQSEDDFRRANLEFMSRAGEWFKRQVKAGRLKKLPRAVFSALLMGPIQEYTRMYLAGHSEMDPGQAADYLTKAAWSNLKA